MDPKKASSIAVFLLCMAHSLIVGVATGVAPTVMVYLDGQQLTMAESMRIGSLVWIGLLLGLVTPLMLTPISMGFLEIRKKQRDSQEKLDGGAQKKSPD